MAIPPIFARTNSGQDACRLVAATPRWVLRGEKTRLLQEKTMDGPLHVAFFTGARNIFLAILHNSYNAIVLHHMAEKFFPSPSRQHAPRDNWAANNCQLSGRYGK